MVITALVPADYRLLQQYITENRRHLSRWEPIRNQDYYGDEAIKGRLSLALQEYNKASGVYLVALNHDENEVIAQASYTNIVQGAFQACHLGYSLAEKHQGQGLMLEMLAACNTFVFERYGLHRIMANYMQENVRSGRLLKRLDFEQEGLARSYLKIAGKWQDHVLTSKLNPAHLAQPD